MAAVADHSGARSRPLDHYRGMGAQQHIEIDVATLGQRLDPVFEQLVHMIRAVKAQKNQNVIAQNCR